MMSTGHCVSASGDLCRRGAVLKLSVVFDGHLGDQRHLTPGRLPYRQYRLAQFVEVAESLENNCIHPRLGERRCLLPEQIASLGKTHRTQWFQPYSQWAHRPGNERLVACHFPGDPHARLVDLPQLFGEPEPAQTLAIRTVGVGFDDLGARPHILLVHIADQSRQREVQFVIAAVDENALGVKRRTHGPIGHQNPVQQRFLEFRAAVFAQLRQLP